MDELDGYVKALIIMGMITVSVVVWFLIASLAGEFFDHKPATPDEPEPQPEAPPAATAAAPADPRPAALDRTPADPRLLAAVSASNWAAAHQLLRAGISPRGVDTQGRSLLELATRKHDEQMVQLLKTHGAKRSG